MCGTNTKTTASQTQNSSFSQGYAYDPNSMTTYQGLLPGISNVLQNYMSDPLKSGFFNKAFALSNNMIGQQGQTQQANLLSNLGKRGLTMGNIPAFGMAQQGAIQRGTSANQGANLTNLLLGFSKNQLTATQMAQAFNPLVTGVSGTGNSSGTSEQNTSTSGLGTWLPQLLSAGIGAASMFADRMEGGGGTKGPGPTGSGGYGPGGYQTTTFPGQPGYTGGFSWPGMSTPTAASSNPYLSSFNNFRGGY